MSRLYIADTNALISSFPEIFKNDKNNLSDFSSFIIREAIFNKNSKYLLSIPSIVFIELRRIKLIEDELTKKFYYEVYLPICESENTEVRAIDSEILESMLKLDGVLENHEINDKIIVSSAIVLNCPILSTDLTFKTYAEDNPELLSVLS